MPKSAELILQPNLLSVVVVEPFGPSFREVIEKLGQDQALQIVECVSAMDALSVVRQLSSCIVLAHASTAHEVNQHLTLLKTLAPQIQTRRTVRMIATVESTVTPELIEKLTVFGASEIMPDQAAAKAILFKLERHLKALPKPVGDDGTGRGASAAAREAYEQELATAPPAPPGVRLVAALETPKDCWSLAGGGVRIEEGRWVVRLRGPGQDLGQWVSDGRGGASRATLWRWTVEGEDAAHADVAAQTGWYFSGEERPEYRRGLWCFASTRPSLAYYVDGKPAEHRFQLGERGALLIAADSGSGLAAARPIPTAVASHQSVQVALAAVPEPAPEPVRVPAAPAPSAATGPRVVLVEPLKLLSDFWLLEKNYPKRVADRWLIQLVGPGPAVGRWVARSPGGGSAEKWWRWEPDAGTRDPFHKELGHWFFYGLSPNFNNGIWAFASSAPELGFYHKGECYGAKFRMRDEWVLEMAKDSVAALRGLSAVRSSFERTVQPRHKDEIVPAPAIKAVAAPVAPDDPRADWIGKPPTVEGAPAVAVAVADPDKAGLDKIFAVNPPGPTLSALALVFLASELVGKRDRDVRSRLNRYCAYLYASFGGLRSELWIESPEHPGTWICVGTPDGTEGQFGDLARRGPGQRTWNALPALSVEVRPALQNPIGMLVVAGRGANLIKGDYAEIAARAAVGLVFGARSERKAHGQAGDGDAGVGKAA